MESMVTCLLEFSDSKRFILIFYCDQSISETGMCTYPYIVSGIMSLSWDGFADRRIIF